MEIRNLGSSGLKISAISYGNWLTHGSQVEEDAPPRACDRPWTRASPRSTPRTSTPTPPPRRCSARPWRGSGARAWRSSPRSSGRPGPAGTTTRASSRKHIMESIDGSLRRLGTDYVDLYQAHRYDHETPLEETMEAFADVVRSGKALYIGVSEWTRRGDPRAARARPRAADPAGVQPAAVLDAVAGHRGRGGPDLARSWASARSCGRRSPRAC